MKKGDLILIFAVLIFAVCLFLPSGSSENLIATIYVDGEVFETIDLSSVSTSYEIEINECVLLVQNDGVSFISSTCSDLLCVNRGKLTSSSSAMACIPNNVVIEISEDSSSFHAVAY